MSTCHRRQHGRAVVRSVNSRARLTRRLTGSDIQDLRIRYNAFVVVRPKLILQITFLGLPA